MLRKNPREKMTNRDVLQFFHTQTLRFQHVTKAFQSKYVLPSPFPDRVYMIGTPSYIKLVKTVNNVLEGHMLI
jgi:hypothetical protein